MSRARLLNGALNEVGERSFVSVKAGNHRLERNLGLKPLSDDPVASFPGEKNQKRELRSSVALAERMDGIQLGKEMGGLAGEGMGVEPSQISLLGKTCEKPLHLAVDVLGIAEHTVLLENPLRANFPRPPIHVLEQVAVNGEITAVTQPAAGERLAKPQGGHFALELLELRLIAQPRAIDEHRRSWVAVRIGLRLVHRAGSALAVGPDNGAPALLVRKALAIEFRRAFLGARTQFDALNGTDGLEPSVPENHAAGRAAAPAGL